MKTDDILFQSIVELEEDCWVFSDWNNPKNEGVPLLSSTIGEYEYEYEESSQRKEENDATEPTEPSTTSDNAYLM
jgi:hypothetical protein